MLKEMTLKFDLSYTQTFGNFLQQTSLVVYAQIRESKICRSVALPSYT